MTPLLRKDEAALATVVLTFPLPYLEIDLYFFANSRRPSGRETHVSYNWRASASTEGNCISWFCLLATRSNVRLEQTSEDMLLNSAGLAQCLLLLREYLRLYGMPDKGGQLDQEFVLCEVARDLYAGGTPLWALESVMQKATKGLTGRKRVNWNFQPRKAFVFYRDAKKNLVKHSCSE